MQLSSYGFIFIFLPIVLIVYYTVGMTKRGGGYQRLLLILASAVFIAMSDWLSLAVIAVSALINYLLSLRVSENKTVFTFAVLFNVLLLGFFKYFAASLPLGISFYTFLQIDYLCYVCRGGRRFEGATSYLNYVTFFPKVSSGPILDAAKDSAPFMAAGEVKADWERLGRGLFLLAVGLFKKAVIADTLALFADAAYALDEMNMLQAWAAIISYAFQLYFDFGGYSDMAIGIGALLGYELPVNFDSPYLAEGIGDFWNRWHISLSSALKRLIYIPLGGNRRGRLRTCINLLIVFLISGIWHGAGINFVLWGLGHGLLICAERGCKGALKKIPRAIKSFLTFIAVSLLWVPFRAESFEKTCLVAGSAFNPAGIGKLSSLGKLANDGIIPFSDGIWAAYLIACIVICAAVILQKQNSAQLYKRFRATKRTLFVTVALLVVSTLHLSRLAVFVYTNF